jgi:hypothetical protein
MIDDVRIYAYALSVADIQALYLSTKADPNDLLSIPDEFILNQNYPNPFNLQTTLRYQLPVDGNITLDIVDLNGRVVRTILNEYKQAGTYRITWNAQNISSGIYFFMLKAENIVLIKKCVLLK